MFTRIQVDIQKFFHQETLAERGKRMLPGALYCVSAASIYSVVSPVINVIFYPDLHLAMDWGGLLIHWVELGIVAALAGAIVGWFTETYEGVVFGGVILSILLLVGNLVASLVSGRDASLMGQSIIITILPLVGALILLAWAIRMAINRHVHIRQREKPEIQRKRLVQLTALVCLVGLVPGVFALFGTASLSSIRSMNKTLQNYAIDPMLEFRFPYEKVPALKDHFGMDYSLYVHTSMIRTVSLEITIHYGDGYSVTCLVPQLDREGQMILDVCNEGTTINFP